MFLFNKYIIPSYNSTLEILYCMILTMIWAEFVEKEIELLKGPNLTILPLGRKFYW